MGDLNEAKISDLLIPKTKNDFNFPLFIIKINQSDCDIDPMKKVHTESLANIIYLDATAKINIKVNITE